MIITGIKLDVTHKKAQLEHEIIKRSGMKNISWRIIKRSVDARRDSVKFVYTAEAVAYGSEFALPERLHVPQTRFAQRPVVVGAGPCGLMCAYILARAGANPILLERGKPADERVRDVSRFFSDGVLDPESNIQFGEGGAGTFSDGKLTTRINDPLCREVTEILYECGAPEDIRWLAKPHIGTDMLAGVVSCLRKKITDLGGSVHFNEKLVGFESESGRLTAALGCARYATDTLVLAIGHSARDTFEMLNGRVEMIPKAFSVGVRIEHNQQLINTSQYGKYAQFLPNADYNLSYHTEKRRGVYTFCMCPGGTVVAAASEKGGVVTNGMSTYARDGQNANSALLVGVGPSDFGNGVMDGVEFQRSLEKAAFAAGGKNYHAPCQQLADFMAHRPSRDIGKITPTYLPGVTPCDLHTVLPDYVTKAMEEAVPVFGRRLHGFDGEALLTGVETRSSSPIRILRSENMQSSVCGIYPAGEGAGYAGGIMSAAADGIRTALAVIENHKNNP